MAEIITLTVKQVGVSEAEKSLNNMLTTIKAINSTPINVSVISSGARAAEQYKETVTATQTEVKKLSQSFKDTEKSGDSLLKNVIKNAQWYYISGAVSTATRSFKDAIAAMKEADAEMVSIQKVTGYTKEQMDRLSDSAYALASAYGRTAQEILSAETTFARAGYTDQIEDLAELAVLTQNVGDVNADTASKFLIAADAAWKLGGNEKELTKIIDGMNNVTNKNAVDMKALTEGLTVSASAFAEAGESAQTYTAMVGAGVAATQRSGNEVARAMRTIIMNVRQIRGETEDGELIDGESIANAAKALKEYADISTLQNGELRKTYDVLDELAGKWESLGSVAKSAITEALAGKYRANILSALLNDWDSVSKMMQDYADGIGSALEENEFYLQSWDAKTKQLQSTWTEFVAKTVDEDWIKDLISSVTWLIEGLGSLGNALLILGGIIATFKMPSILSFLSSAVAGIGRLIAMIKLATTNFTAFSLVANTTQLAIGAITAAITVGIVAYNKIKQAQEEARQAAIDAGEASTTEAKEIVSLYQNYEDLRKAVEDGTGSKTEFIDASDRLIDKLGIEKSSVYDLKKELGGLSGAYKEATAAKIESALYDAKSATAAAEKGLRTAAEKAWGSMFADAANLKDPSSILADYQGWIDERNKMIDEGDTSSIAYKEAERVISAYKQAVEEYNKAVEDQTYLEGAHKAALDGTLDSYLKSEDAVNDYSDALDNAAETEKTTVETLQEYAKTLKQQESDLTTASQALAEYQQNGRISASTMKSLISMSDQYVNALTDENGKLDVSEKKLRDLVDAILDDVDATNDLIGVTKKSSGAMGSFVTGLKNAAKQSGVTDDAIDGVVAQMIIFNNTALSVSDKIAALQALALQAGVTQSAIAGISLNNIGRDAGMTVEDAQKKYGMSAAEAQRYVKSQAEKAKNNDQALIDYWNSLASKIPETKTSSGGGGGSSSDANLEAHKQKVELLKSELTLLEKQNASEDTQKDKMRQIQQALHAQAQYLRSIGGSQSDINALSAEWWEWQEKINGTLKNTDDLLNELQGVMSDKLSDLSDQRQNELDAIDAQIDALKQQKDTRDEQLDLEEKILAVQQAQAKLANAQNERTVRQYNARTGQWEWVADQKEVDSAQEALDEAKKDLEDFKANMAYEAALAELEAQKKTINERYDDLETAYKDFLKSIKEKTRGIGEILQDIWKNATPELRQIIQENAELFRQFGVDVSQLSDAVNDTAKKLYGISQNGDKYEIGSDKGLDFINNKPAGSQMVGGDGSTWTKNADGTVTIVDKDGITYTVYPNGGSGGTEDSTGGSASGPKYSGTVFAKRLDGKGDDYKISSANGLNFLNNALAGEKLDGGDGSHWVKNEDGTTSITDKYGIAYKVYDQGGILHGMGGIKATMQDEGVTPPDVTALLRKRLLTPVEDKTFSQNMDSIRWMMSGNGVGANAVHNASYDNHSIGTQNNGNVYKFNGITINEPQASGMTLKQFADIAHNLGNFS